MAPGRRTRQGSQFNPDYPFPPSRERPSAVDAVARRRRSSTRAPSTSERGAQTVSLDHPRAPCHYGVAKRVRRLLKIQLGLFEVGPAVSRGLLFLRWAKHGLRSQVVAREDRGRRGTRGLGVRGAGIRHGRGSQRDVARDRRGTDDERRGRPISAVCPLVHLVGVHAVRRVPELERVQAPRRPRRRDDRRGAARASQTDGAALRAQGHGEGRGDESRCPHGCARRGRARRARRTGAFAARAHRAHVRALPGRRVAVHPAGVRPGRGASIQDAEARAVLRDRHSLLRRIHRHRAGTPAHRRRCRAQGPETRERPPGRRGLPETRRPRIVRASARGTEGRRGERGEGAHDTGHPGVFGPRTREGRRRRRTRRHSRIRREGGGLVGARGDGVRAHRGSTAVHGA